MKSAYKQPLLATVAALALQLPMVAMGAGPSLSFGEEGFVDLGYALQIWGTHRSYTSPTHDGSSFDTHLRRNRITLSGQKDDMFGFYAQIEAGNDSKEGRDDRSIYFRDAYVTVDYSDELRLIAGRFKNTFSRENLEACLEPLTLDRGSASYAPFGGSRDTGVVLWGNLADAALQYRLMFADGREGDRVPKKSPRITTRVHWSLLDPEYDYGYRGTYLGTRRILTLGAAYDYQADAAYTDYSTLSGKKDYKAWTVDGFFEYPFKRGTWTLSAAWFDYSLGNAINKDPDPDLPANTELDGYYLKTGYLLPKPVGPGRLQLYLRRDDNRYHLADHQLDHTINSAGANYYLNGQGLKLTLDYQRYDYRHPVSGNAALKDGHEITLGFQFIL